MKATLIIGLCFAFVSSALCGGAANNDAQDVSIIRLIASPRDYAHKLVRVVGYLDIEFEGDAIYLHEEDCKRALTTNALWIQAKPEMMKELKQLSRQYVIIEGVFVPSNKGHMGLFSGALDNITRVDIWNPGPASTVAP